MNEMEFKLKLNDKIQDNKKYFGYQVKQIVGEILITLRKKPRRR